MKDSQNSGTKHNLAFTLIELLVVIAIIAILAALLLPVLNRSKSKAMSILCLNNIRQLSLAWLQYAHDSDDRIPYASPAQGEASNPYAWVSGAMNFDPANQSNWDISVDLEKSPLWPYCGGAAGIWKCPGDRSTVVPSFGPFQGRKVPRVRSVSMLSWLGGFGGQHSFPGPGFSSPPWRLYLKLTDVVDPGPSRTLLFWDEREDAINSGNFAVVMNGFPDQPELTDFGGDMPASYHNGAGTLSFVDGHAESRRWRDVRTTPPISYPNTWPDLGPCPNNKDLVWLRERATRRIE